MMRIKRIINVALIIAAALINAAALWGKGTGENVNAYGAPEGESPKHEMRGAWVATVYGIDWPSTTGTTAACAEEQRKELRRILDILQEGGLNAVMLQVRSMSDAMYRSCLEPWSAYLTGERGVAPAKGWDPLAFAVDEAHKRGMELHAWVNPFRLANGAAPVAQKAAKGSVVFDPKGKGWVLSYSKKAKNVSRKGKKGGRKRAAQQPSAPTVSILDPGNPAARAHIVAVCRDIVKNYDVDGLIFDDYFYPDGLPLGGGYDFSRWQKETAGMGEDAPSQADWRRGNVAKTVEAVHDMLRKERPWVRFGISPAGVAGGNGEACSRYGLPEPERGRDWMYDRIYCDPLEWLDAGSVDYVSPQIYWATDHETNPYEPISRWWGKVALTFNRHCYPSQKVLALPAGEAAWREQGGQVEINRENSTATGGGSIFYSTAHISGKKAAGVAEYLRNSCYSSPALMPPMEWKDAADPGAVKGLKRDGGTLSWYPQPDMRYVVYAVPDELSPLDVIADTGRNFLGRYIMCVTYDHEVAIAAGRLKGYWFAVAPYDRYGNEWEASILQ